MANKEKIYTGTGALTGLALGVLIRNLVAGNQDVSWGDYATWGGIGAAVGGAAGFGLAAAGDESHKDDPNWPRDPKTGKPLSEEQVAEVRGHVEAARKKIKALEDRGTPPAPGIFQGMLSPWQWVAVAAANPTIITAVHKWNKAVDDIYKRIEDAGSARKFTDRTRLERKVKYADIWNNKRNTRIDRSFKKWLLEKPLFAGKSKYARNLAGLGLMLLANGLIASSSDKFNNWLQLRMQAKPGANFFYNPTYAEYHEQLESLDKGLKILNPQTK